VTSLSSRGDRHDADRGERKAAPLRPAQPPADIETLQAVAPRGGSWQRLKARGNPDCRWAFYDRSHWLFDDC
jgi:predicted RNA-binding Zn ribbon-like protein